MAVAKKKAAPTAKKAAPRKSVTKSVSKVKAAPVTVSSLLATALEIPAPIAKTRKRTAHRFSYTGKLAADTKPQTPQFVALIHAMQDIEDPTFDSKDFDLHTLVNLAVKEGILEMKHTKKPEQQKTRIVNYYRQRLVDEGYVTRCN